MKKKFKSPYEPIELRTWKFFKDFVESMGVTNDTLVSCERFNCKYNTETCITTIIPEALEIRLEQKDKTKGEK